MIRTLQDVETECFTEYYRVSYNGAGTFATCCFLQNFTDTFIRMEAWA